MEEFVGSKLTEVRPVNGSQEEIEVLWDKLIATRAASKKGKNKDKQKALATASAAALATEATAAGAAPSVGRIDGKSSSEDSPTNSTERKLHVHGVSEKVGEKRGVQDFSTAVPTKKVKAKDLAPANADKKLWASLFTSAHGKQSVETYSCRSTSGRGWM